MLLLILVQAAEPASAPDIELDVRATARSVRIERSGEASLRVQGGEGSLVDVEAPDANGRRRLRNVQVRVKAEARIADPAEAPRPQEPPPPQ